MDKQFDVSPQAKRLYEEKKAQRLALRNQYMKSITNPHRHATGEGGTVFDANLFRFMAMRAKEYQTFRPTPINALYGMAIVAVPMFLYGWAIMSRREEKERSYRQGEVAYRDRQFKLI